MLCLYLSLRIINKNVHGSCMCRYRENVRYVLRARLSIAISHSYICQLVSCCWCAAPSSFARSLDSMRRYHLKFNSIKCSTGSTFYSIYLANCVCIRVLSDVEQKKTHGDTVAGCQLCSSFFTNVYTFARSLSSSGCCCSS